MRQVGGRLVISDIIINLIIKMVVRLGQWWSQYQNISLLDLQRENGRQLWLMSYFLINHSRFTGEINLFDDI